MAGGDEEEPAAEEGAAAGGAVLDRDGLGSGKTTLLRHVLTAPHGLRVAVIQNELSAATGLEADTMVGPDGETFAKWLELANGCVCCEVRDELAKGIETLLELKGGFDYVLVETTGMADPGPVAESFWLDAELEGRLYLDGVVCVVDCENFDSEAVGGSMEACRQVGCADVIILNKASGGGGRSEGEAAGPAAPAASPSTASVAAAPALAQRAPSSRRPTAASTSVASSTSMPSVTATSRAPPAAFVGAAARLPLPAWGAAGRRCSNRPAWPPMVVLAPWQSTTTAAATTTRAVTRLPPTTTTTTAALPRRRRCRVRRV